MQATRGREEDGKEGEEEEEEEECGVRFFSVW